MAKKQQTVTKKPTLQDRIARNRGELLTIYIKLTKKATGMEDQLQRLEKELLEWKKANPKERIRDL